MDIDILGLPVCRAGLVVDFDEEEALRRFEEPEVTIEVDLHAEVAKRMGKQLVMTNIPFAGLAPGLQAKSGMPPGIRGSTRNALS